MTSIRRGENKRLGLCRCGAPRHGKYTRCRKCLSRAAYESRIRSIYQVEADDDDPLKANAILRPGSTCHCGHFGCKWVGVRRDLWKHIKERHS